MCKDGGKGECTILIDNHTRELLHYRKCREKGIGECEAIVGDDKKYSDLLISLPGQNG